jgi:4-amino-4-deoxy-L-arabinose transferase-like glycosyltransferase
VQNFLPTSSDSLSRNAKIAWTLLILATLYLCYFSHLGIVGFVGPDEPRYAWIARAMADTGDWVTPRLYGQPWFEKPALYYWEAALSFKIFGPSETAARLPSAFSALLGTLALAWLAWRMYGAQTARWLLLLLPTSIGLLGFARAAATDMPFSAMLAIAMAAAAVVMDLDAKGKENPSRHATNRWPALIVFGFFLGLAVLAKGPAGIVLCGGAVFFWALFTRRWHDAIRLLHPIAITALCLTALPWYIVCARRNPDFFQVFIIEHNFKRYLTPEFQHIQPFWYYVPVVLVAFLPWSAALGWSAIVGAMRSRRTSRSISDTSLFLLSWALFCLLFFTISKSKLPGYVLPAFFPIAALLARSFTSLAEEFRKSFAFTLFAFAVLLGGLGAIASNLRLQQPWAVAIASLLFFLLAVANSVLSCAFFCAPGTRARNILGGLSAAPILLTLLFLPKLLPNFLANQVSPRILAAELEKRPAVAREVVTDTTIHRNTRYALSFYLHRELQEWNENQPSDWLLLSNRNRCAELQSKELACESEILYIPGGDYFLLHVTQPLAPAGRQLD